MRRIVVGVDGSAHAERALRWAIHEPRVLAATIELVSSPSAAAGAPTPGRSRSSSAHSTIDVPVNLDVDRVIRPGPAAGVPLEQTTTDHLLVVVTRGRNALGRAVFGSVSHQCLQHAPGPVIVVP